jgi:hypothetical protein
MAAKFVTLAASQASLTSRRNEVSAQIDESATATGG